MKVLKIFLIAVLLLFVSVVVYGYSQFRGFGRNQPKERFVITLNISEEQIINDLQQKGFLRNKTIFNWVLDFKKWHGKISPGAYQVSKSMNVYQLAEILVFNPYQKWAVIPSGKRKEQVALILQRALNWPESMVKSFIVTAEEGYLYPDTYLINVDADPLQIVTKLRINFNDKFDAKLQTDLLAQNIRNDTALKIASLIERESGGDEDKAIIAGVIWNRLKKGMELEIDATVQYAITSQQLSAINYQPSADFVFWQALGPGVVRTVDSPYNTYLNKGLPPGPICSPSLASIRAVAYPAETDALYYLHSSDKVIHTAKTYKEHLENIKKYLN